MQLWNFTRKYLSLWNLSKQFNMQLKPKSVRVNDDSIKKNHYLHSMLNIFRCPLNFGTYAGFCSSSCSCQNPYECQNEKCRYETFYWQCDIILNM